MAEILFYIIILILAVDYTLERVLDYLNLRNISEELPDKLKGIYDEEKYRKSQAYEKENSRFGFITSTFTFVVILIFLFLDGFAYVDSLARQISDNPIIIALVFFGILGLAFDILTTPFDIYHTFVIEEKYGFNKTSPRLYITDKIKGWMVSAVLGGGILALIVWFYTLTGENFWIYAWILVSGFSIFMAMFYSTLIVPLFNKQTPLEKGELREEIENFSTKAGFKLDNVFVIDGSKRSTKANAYFAGLGSKKRVVLFDTLINDLHINELVSVLAHEIGHYKKKHIIWGMLTGILQTGIMLYILSLFIAEPALSQALGATQHGFHLALVAFGILYSPISTILGLAMNQLSRKNEYEADKFAVRNYDGDALGNALKKLSVKNLSNLTPHPAYVFFHYSHPTLLQRLDAMEKQKNAYKTQ